MEYCDQLGRKVPGSARGGGENEEMNVRPKSYDFIFIIRYQNTQKTIYIIQRMFSFYDMLMISRIFLVSQELRENTPNVKSVLFAGNLFLYLRKMFQFFLKKTFLFFCLLEGYLAVPLKHGSPLF